MESQTPEIPTQNRKEIEVTDLGTEVNFLTALYNPKRQKDRITTLEQQFPPKS